MSETCPEHIKISSDIAVIKTTLERDSKRREEDAMERREWRDNLIKSLDRVIDEVHGINDRCLGRMATYKQFEQHLSDKNEENKHTVKIWRDRGFQMIMSIWVIAISLAVTFMFNQLTKDKQNENIRVIGDIKKNR